MDASNYTSTLSRLIDDPRTKSSRYSKGMRLNFDEESFDFAFTQFLIDSNYVGDPPHVQVSIDNLNDNVDENFLKKDLSRFGPLRSLEIIRNPRTGQHLGLAKVQFEDVLVAKACVDNFNGKQLMGRQLKVFLDIRFAIIERLKTEKLNPRSQPTAPSRQRLEDRIATLMRQPNSVLSAIVPRSANGSTASTIQTSSPSISVTSQAASHNFSSVSDNYDHADNASSHHSHSYKDKDIDKKRADPDHHSRLSSYQSSHNKTSSYHRKHTSSSSSSYNDYRHRRDSDSNHMNHDYHDRIRHEDTWSDHSNEEKRQEKLELTEKQIDDEVLPYCFKEFFKVLTKNLESTILKKLRESYGYQCLEKAQIEYKQKQDRIQLQLEQERHERDLQKQYETRFILSKTRRNAIDRQAEVARPRVNIVRGRTGDDSSTQVKKNYGETDMRRVNRSSAFVSEPDRRGSRSTSLDSDRSDLGSGSSISRSRSPSNSSYSSSSRSGSRSSSYSSCPRSRSRSSSVSSSKSDFRDGHARSRKSRKSDYDEERNISHGGTNVMDYSTQSNNESQDERTDLEHLAASALLDFGSKNVTTSSQNVHSKKKSSHVNQSMSDFIVDDDDDDAVSENMKIVRKKSSVAKKRKKKNESNFTRVASEYRSAKKFASDPSSRTTDLVSDTDENAMVLDENIADSKPLSRYLFKERTPEQKLQILNDLPGTLTEEDINLLRKIHEARKSSMPFGSDESNKLHLHLTLGKVMIDSKTTERHPRWWRGCSRCDVIELSEKERVETEPDELNFEELQQAPIKSNVIQAGTSSRRDLRGDQRRIAVLNPELDADILKLLTTNTLQMRAKNLRFSRSKIHKWGLFACEKIASGDAVIEYVGEKIRPSLADHREKIVYTNLPTHDGSSYFFRVDTDVIDATLKGNKARFINHCCNPNCIAKVIKHDNGSNSIVIYAKQPIQEDEEITYDYKFPIEETEEKIQCNCRAQNCRKYLN